MQNSNLDETDESSKTPLIEGNLNQNYSSKLYDCSYVLKHLN